MAERRATGGTKEFHYSKEDLRRIRSTDTESTKAFKEAYQQYASERLKEKKLSDDFHSQRLRLTIALACLGIALLVLLVLSFLH